VLRITVAALTVVVVGGLVAGCGSAPDATPVTVANAANSFGYNDIVAALKAGKDVEVTTEISQCTTPQGVAGPAVTGGLHISTFQVQQGQYIAFSDTHESLTAQNTRLTEFIRYRVTPDGTTTLTSTALDADNKVLGTNEFDCRIGKGAYFHWS
jgi:hypothetical protein